MTTENQKPTDAAMRAAGRIMASMLKDDESLREPLATLVQPAIDEEIEARDRYWLDVVAGSGLDAMSKHLRSTVAAYNKAEPAPAIPSPTIEPGDVVRLISGGPRLTVGRVDTSEIGVYESTVNGIMWRGIERCALRKVETKPEAAHDPAPHWDMQRVCNALRAHPEAEEVITRMARKNVEAWLACQPLPYPDAPQPQDIGEPRRHDGPTYTIDGAVHTILTVFGLNPEDADNVRGPIQGAVRWAVENALRDRHPAAMSSITWHALRTAATFWLTAATHAQFAEVADALREWMDTTPPLPAPPPAMNAATLQLLRRAGWRALEESWMTEEQLNTMRRWLESDAPMTAPEQGMDEETRRALCAAAKVAIEDERVIPELVPFLRRWLDAQRGA